MTLEELYTKVKSAKKNRQLSRRQLLEENDNVIAEKEAKMGDGTISVHLTVFESGYVLYEEDEKYTIFHLDDIRQKPVEYKTVDETFIPRNNRKISAHFPNIWKLNIILLNNPSIKE